MREIASAKNSKYIKRQFKFHIITFLTVRYFLSYATRNNCNVGILQKNIGMLFFSYLDIKMLTET